MFQPPPTIKRILWPQGGGGRLNHCSAVECYKVCGVRFVVDPKTECRGLFFKDWYENVMCEVLAVPVFVEVCKRVLEVQSTRIIRCSQAANELSTLGLNGRCSPGGFVDRLFEIGELIENCREGSVVLEPVVVEFIDNALHPGEASYTERDCG